MKRIAIFEVDAVDVDRFHAPLFYDGESPCIVFLEDPLECSKYRRSGRFKATARIECAAYARPQSLRRILVEQGIELVLLTAQRIPDLQMIYAARLAGCRVSYIQHGMYIPFMKRDASFFISKIGKTFRYFYYSINLGLCLHRPLLAVTLARVHVLGASRCSLDSYPNLLPDYAAVFSDYWKDWHVEHYRFHPDSISVVGSPDLARQEFGPPLPPNWIAYCYQTLVEDGRIEKSLMLAFYGELVGFCRVKQLRLIVKAHPRASPEMIAHLQELGAEIETRCVPNTNTVIGHYSSLLAFWGAHGRSVICHLLAGHEIHESISSWATVISSFHETRALRAEPATTCEHYFAWPKPVAEVRLALSMTHAS